jgi:F0F1-type ATP synthase membrane subunit b/b'
MLKFLALGWAATMAVAILLGFSMYAATGKILDLKDQRDAAVNERNAALLLRNQVESTLARREAENASQGRKSAQATEALKRAQGAAPEWSATVVPDGVQKALKDALGVSQGSAREAL